MRKPKISQRKQPQQVRSVGLVAIILQAAAKVLAREGAHRFTTARVAETAGISVGSIYQYFPNKAAILFKLQSDEWQQTTELLRKILEDVGTPALQRLRILVHAFLQSECDEAKIRGALGDAAPLYRDAPEARQAMASGHRIVQAFMLEALPEASAATRELAGNLITTTFSSVGKSFSESPRTRAETQIFADALADMLCAYLAGLSRIDSSTSGPNGVER